MIKRYLYLIEDNVKQNEAVRKRLEGIDYEEKYYPCDDRFISALPVFIIDCDGKEWKRFEEREVVLDLSEIKAALATDEAVMKNEITGREGAIEEARLAREEAQRVKEEQISVLREKDISMTKSELIELLKLRGLI